MTPIFSSAALKTRQREIKDIARSEVVHITENGNAAFVLLSEELFEQKLSEAADAAAFDERIRACVEAGDACLDEGRFIDGTQNFFAALDQRLAEQHA